jgi:Minichromosome loss protein, Mcl1, middle region
MVACANGTLLTFPGTKIVSSLPLASSVAVEESNVKNDVSITAEPTSFNEKTMKDSDTFFDDSDDENVFGGSTQGDPNDDVVNRKSNPFIDDEADDDTGESVSKASPVKKKSKEFVTGNKGMSSYDSDDNMPDGQDDLDGLYSPAYHDRMMSVNDRRNMQFDLPVKQPPFAPSSSPLDLPRRYLCWNSIGSVTLRHSDTGDLTNLRNTVDINFTDSGVRRPISFTDNLGFILGSLGEDGAIFATDLVEDDDDDDDDLLDQVGVPGLSEATRQAVKKSRRKQNDSDKPMGSSIYFHRFETFAALREKDWYLTLPSGERALGCATGEGWAAVMTR